MQAMLLELSRLGIGLLMLMFHRQIADFVMERERTLVVLARQRGLPLPPAPTTEMGRNIYFCIGTVVVLYQMLRIWLSIHPY